jgi:hypothetical protein
MHFHAEDLAWAKAHIDEAEGGTSLRSRRGTILQ